MKTTYILPVIVMLLSVTSLKSQVTVSGALSGNGPYTSLRTACIALNSAAQTGATISISITGNTTEPGTATLNAGAWVSVVIQPSGGAWTISGNLVAGLINLNDADNVTIDGLNTGGNSLTIDNTNAGATY